MLPVYLVGGLAVQIRGELGFDAAGLGIVVSSFFAVSALTSVPAGRLVQRVGAGAGMGIGAGMSACSLLAVGFAHAWWQLVISVAIGGFSNAIGQLGANLALADHIPVRRQGLAFGSKQAAVPAASVLAGLAVPAIGLSVGWRWAFLGGVLLPVGFGVAILRSTTLRRRTHQGPRGRAGRATDTALAPLVVLAASGALGTLAANSLAAFLVASIVERGVTSGDAGLLLALGSAVGVAMRVTAGWHADRGDGEHLRLVASLLALGGVGLVWLSFGRGLPAIAVATVVAFAAAWGWNGIFNLAIVRHNPTAPAAATGITQAGLYLGGVVGPTLFGHVVEWGGYPSAWRVAAASTLVGAGGILVGRRMLRTSTAGARS